MELRNVQAVFVDADDTLWENNIYFMQSLQWLCQTGRRLGFTDYATGRILHRYELRNIPFRGFGYDSYEISLLQALRHLCQAHERGRMLHPGLRRQALEWTRFLRSHPIVLRPGVARTLPLLKESYQTIMVTKGHHGDQMGKVFRSGLESLFHAIEVVPDKKPQNYRDVLKKYNLDPAHVVMVGNSPGGDINAAKRAGIRTIFVPHPQTWEYDMEPILPEEPATLHVANFEGLRIALGLKATEKL
ncbi:MAG: HAD family hydrolase [Sumerlaeia bacterium]